VKAATGEEADEESLGGAEMHSKKSGVSDYLAQDEEHAIYLGRQIVCQMNYKKRSQLPREHFETVQPPVYDPDEILGIVGGDIRTPYDSREVIARIVDGSRFHEFKPEYATTIITCWARIHGVLVGILANNGVLFSDTANKAAHFIQICDKRAIPLVYLQNITGFMVGQKQEQDGIIKHGSKLINAVANASVPAITIVMGSSFGAGNYAMCGRAYQARFLFAWPGSKVAVMGSDQLVTVLGNIGREAAAKSKKEYDENAAAMATAAFKKKVESESEAFYITSECLDDGIIDPRDTRDVIGMCLSVVHNSAIVPGESYGISRM
jgi:acetyl-CoA carboxylase carboxyltransferase component